MVPLIVCVIDFSIFFHLLLKIAIETIVTARFQIARTIPALGDTGTSAHLTQRISHNTARLIAQI
ncbi:MAG: hypothetical protein ACLPY5_05385 [Candidatus Bathyarchaeia archaeon]